MHRWRAAPKEEAHSGMSRREEPMALGSQVSQEQQMSKTLFLIANGCTMEEYISYSMNGNSSDSYRVAHDAKDEEEGVD